MPILYRCVRMADETAAMTLGWLLLFGSQWYFYSSTHGTEADIAGKMVSRLVCALFVSYFGFACIYFVDKIADWVRSTRAAFNAVIRAIILAVAMCWEGVFDRAIESISNKGEAANTRVFYNVMLSLFLVAIMLPAMVMYFLPRDMAGPLLSKEEKKARAIKAAAATAESTPAEAEPPRGSAAPSRPDGKGGAGKGGLRT